MIVASRTHIGNVRASNQDALLVCPGLYGVADGMGGHKAGDVASRLAVDEVSRLLIDQKPDENTLARAIEQANRVIFREQAESFDLSGMGTTLTMIWEDQDRMLLGHVGDSRAYLLRGGEMEQISEDHSMVAEMVRKGLLTPEQAKCHPYRNVITRALGSEETVQVDVTLLDKQKGDVYLICSDGLSEYVSMPQMRDILLARPLEEAADLLLQLALDGGGRDNISLVIAEVAS